MFCDEDDWSRKLGDRRHCRDTYFTENVAVEEVHQVESDVETINVGIMKTNMHCVKRRWARWDNMGQRSMNFSLKPSR